MDEDVDMDAPQISTLREESTPPPSRANLRVKLLVSKNKGKGKSSSPSVSAGTKKAIVPPLPIPQAHVQSDAEIEEEDEEDQLIDDEDDTQHAASTPAVSTSTSGAKRKAPAKKSRPRKSEKLDKDADKIPPAESGEQVDPEGVGISTVGEKPPPKKRAAPRKSAGTAQRSRPKAAPKVAKNPIVPSLDDGALSESYTGTAPSSPLPLIRDGGSEHEYAEQEPVPLPVENAETAPLPVYPLPSKPFPVQPPPKIGTGFAPMLPLDRSGIKVRRWRTANREIRGIAGGRWFARSWVGDKDSEFSNAPVTASIAATHKSGDADKITMPKISGSISAPLHGKGSGRSKNLRAASGISAVPSRAGSIPIDHHPAKAPSKMRNMVAGPAPEEDNSPPIRNTSEQSREPMES